VTRTRRVEHPEKEYAFHNHNIFWALNRGAFKGGMYNYLFSRFLDIAKLFNARKEDYLVSIVTFNAVLSNLMEKGAFVNKSDAEAFELILTMLRKTRDNQEMPKIKGYDISKISAEKITV